MIRTYSELIMLPTFEERYEYLKLEGVVGVSTFGHDRFLNQLIYKTSRWQKLRDQIIIRDNGCDLAVEGFEIFDRIYVHHMNPFLVEDVLEDLEALYDPEFLICTTFRTHNAIHYGDRNQLAVLLPKRYQHDTVPWKNNTKRRNK